MPWDLLIRGGHVVTNDRVEKLDIAVDNGTLVELAPGLPGSARETIDATGLHIFPGLIDAHVHFNEPGRTDWEGFATGSRALAAGGGTLFCDMPLNAHPPTLDAASFDLKRDAAEASSLTDFALWGGLTPDNLDRMHELAERGVIGFKAFMSNSGIEDFARSDPETLHRGMQIAARLGLPVAVHAEDEPMTARLAAEAIAAGRTSYRDYLASRPADAEVRAIEEAIKIARETGCSLHIVHVSSPEGVQAVTAGAQGHDVTCETCPHYLWFTDDDLFRIGAPLKCAPPVRARKSVETMREYLSTGTITTIGSDHSPSPASMKVGDNAFAVWGGIAGVQSTLPAVLTIAHHWSPTVVGRLIAGNVAPRFRLPQKGPIALGNDADLCLVDLDARFTLTRDALLDRHRLSPYVGAQFQGQIKRTVLRGRTIFLDGVTIRAARGRFIAPSGTGSQK